MAAVHRHHCVHIMFDVICCVLLQILARNNVIGGSCSTGMISECFSECYLECTLLDVFVLAN